MGFSELKQYIHAQLQSIYEVQEIDAFLYRMLDFKLNLQRVDVILDPNLEINEADKLFFQNAINQLKQEKPIQYILGVTEFYGLRFTVDKNTLIPRPETEELVAWVIKELGSLKKEIKILDIGTGSGCIPISLAKNLPNAIVTSVDVSAVAQNVAKQNAQENKVAVKFVLSDALDSEKMNTDLQQQKWDIIVSNPPYVRELEKQEINNNVLQYEPHLALFVADNHALIFYEKIGEYALENLKPNGQLFFEINQYLGKETVNLLQQMGFENIEIQKDLNGNDRMIRCVFVSE